MKLKNFNAEIFAGINNRNYQFKDGLNILLGDNEAGKSTVINAIYASLFISPQIKLNTTEGKEFKQRYFPYPDGDFAEAELKFEVENLDYKFYKKWSNSNYAGYLELADGRRIESQKKIAEYKNEILPYAKSTYNNIVFSSQQDIKSTLERINAEENPELIDTINSFLRKAVMELDGVSIDKFRSKLETEIEELCKKWDLKADAVANSDRGINNPYKVGTGKIYDTFIAKEKLRRKLKESKINERKFEELGNEIKELKKEESNLLAQIEELSEIETEINQRATLELEIKNLTEKIDKLTKTAQKWPEIKNELKKLKEKKEQVETKIKNIEAEKERAKKLQQKKDIKKRVEVINSFKNEISELKKLTDRAKISLNQVEKLEEYKNKIAQTKASLKASKLKAKINFSAAEEIKVLSGVEKEQRISEGEIIEADGYLRIKTDQIDIEIESAEIDFSSLKEEYNQSQKEFSKLKNKMQVKNLNEAREKLKKITESKRKIKEKQNKIDEFLAGDRLETLEEKLDELEDIDDARELEVIKKELESLKDKLAELKTEIKIKENKIEEWQAEFQSFKELQSLLIAKRKQKEKVQQKLKELAALPSEYENSEEFLDDLKAIRKKRENINQSLRKKLAKHKELENSLPQASSREMEAELEKLENKFKRLKNKAYNLLKIKRVFEEKLEEMDKNSFKPLVDSFSKNLKLLTAGKYEAGMIDDDFSIKLKSKKQKELPGNLELLSYGTYDAAALALRFAIFDNLFNDYGGFIILDDCLVNLDPERRENAVKLINRYQKKYQIIYTTCDPERAAELEGNIIQI